LKIRYTRKALAQLGEIYSYIEERNPLAAHAVNAHMMRSIRPG
jgi:plasmid stabilization system protein ParE